MECGPEPMICSLNYQSSGFPAVWLKLQIMECGPEPLLITACLQQRLNVTELHQPVWKQIVRLHSDRAVDQLRMLHCPLQRALLCRLFRFGQHVEQIPDRKSVV